MTVKLRLIRAIALVLGLGFAIVLQAAPACVSQNDVGTSEVPVIQAPGGTGGTGAAPGGMGGTGIDADNGGVGGTGAPLKKRPGGIGGTGAVAGGVGGTGISDDNGGVGGTGIVGTITGFASICVNGVEVHFNNNVPVSENGIASSSTRLAIGQVVAVQAFNSRRGLEAGRISILHAYEGPLTALPRDSMPMRVMGQPVRLAKGAQVAAGLRPGDPVRVSGLRDARGEVVASRIDRAPGLKEASAIGPVDRSGYLQGLKLSNHPGPAQEMLVRGHWSGRELDVNQSRPDPSLPFIGRAHNAVIEGLVQGRQDRHLVVGGFNVTLAHDTVFVGVQASQLGLDRRVRINGVFTGAREVQATRIELPRERSDSPASNRHGRLGSSEQDTDDSSGSGNSSGSSGSGNSGDSGDSGNSGNSGNSGSSRGSGNSGSDRSGRSESTGSVIDDTRHGGGDSHGGGDKIERVDVDKSGKSERVEKVDQSGKVEKVERVERVEKVEKVERPEKVEKVDRPEKVEKVDRPEKVEKIEKVDRPEKVEKVEPAEKIDHSGRSG
ncbi:DUF5666 domain-containing protein [Pseudomonas sp. BF-RE-26]|uniref:DUF5666 domain-containing protein n=1 Tax=Pseudomonas sp. BF-RE-26 TaxID=2832396 RepID=UPI001CBD82D6|nr:DUF5666 domain-containing protein [Pseudomonas sp. BF-RE-26]